jgi:hypothetical protein
VQVNAGTLGGRGTIAGAVTVGTGSGAGAVLAPGRRGGKPGYPLTIQSTLNFNSDATYEVGLDTEGAIADQVVANGVTISGAKFSLVHRGRFALTLGTVFTVIDNTATPRQPRLRALLLTLPTARSLPSTATPSKLIMKAVAATT